MEVASAEYPHKRARFSPPARKGRGGAEGAKASSPTNTEDIAGAEGALSGDWPVTGLATGASTKAGQGSNFRNVSACNRCRLRKNRCDQRLPSCATCEKAGVKCVGYDPITKKEIPRSYVFYLESRVRYLEDMLRERNIPFADADVLNYRSGLDPDSSAVQARPDDAPQYSSNEPPSSIRPITPERSQSKKQAEMEKLDKLVSNIETVSMQGASDSRFLGSAAGISFARVVFAAVKSSVSGTNSDKSGVKPSRVPVKGVGASNPGTSMRDSFFGLHTKPTIKPAPFPSNEVGRRLVDFYFEHANPQIPILHRGEFMKMFELAYADGDARVRTPRELYMINIVCAMGAGIFLGDIGDGEREGNHAGGRSSAGKQCQPEEYHASAIVHLESCLSSSNSADRPDGFGGGLEELQAVLLLAGFALLRPVAPGLWYIIGVAVRLAVDLGLHYEDGENIDVRLEQMAEKSKKGQSQDSMAQRELAALERGRREWVRDFRRRLWWCTYSFDRLVSTCVGRPFGITDQVVTTEFPTIIDDKYITPGGFLNAPDGAPSYKHVAYHYFRFRLLQSEVLQVLQHQQAQVARTGGANQRNPYMHTKLPSPFVSQFDSFCSWRMNIDQRLLEWMSSAPTKRDTGVAFPVEFLELNYWQCIIMLYRQSLRVPAVFEGEYNTSDEVQSPSVHNVESREDEDRVFLKVAEAGQRVLRLYRQLHRVHLVNYTFLATHHLFMAGISFLYAIWHSPLVRSRLTLDEVDFTILAATSVLGDLIEKCPPAEACRDAFNRMSKATVQMCMSTTGFGFGSCNSSAAHIDGLDSLRAPSGSMRSNHASSSGGGVDLRGHQNQHSAPSSQQTGRAGPPASWRKPRFDMGLNELLASSSPHVSAATAEGEGQLHIRDSQTLFRSRTAHGGDGVVWNPNPNPDPDEQQPDLTNMYSDYGHPGVESPFQRPAAAVSILDGSSNVQAQMHALGQRQSPESAAMESDENGLADTASIDPSLLPSLNTHQTDPTDTMLSPESYSFNDTHLSNLAQAPGMNFLQSGLQGSELEMTEPGADFGMGLGLEWEGMEHDFSEGGTSGLDLFDGFFFGGGGNYS